MVKKEKKESSVWKASQTPNLLAYNAFLLSSPH